MNSKRWIKNYITVSFIFFALIVTTNFIVDPGNIYLKKIISKHKALEYSNKLFLSEYGLVQTGWNERLISTTLALKSGDFDCVIIGSSHSRQISSVRNTGNINKQCKSLLNLSVSGASIEDMAIFSYIILNNNNLPNKIFINIDPWTLKFKMDKRYGAYENYLNKMDNIILNKKNKYDFTYMSNILKNLINLEYFLASIGKVENKNIFTKEIIYPKYKFSYEEGYVESVTLIDGSHVYSKKWLSEQKLKNKNIKQGGGHYKIKGTIYEKEAIVYIQKILKLYKDKEINVSLVMTPYHPNVFKNGKTKPVMYINEIDRIISKLAIENSVKIYGSFYPEKIDCKEDEFLDFMHAKSKCLNKIDFSK